MEDNFPTDGVWGDGSGGNASDAERWGEADEASVAPPPPTSCCVAGVRVHNPGLRTPALKGSKIPCLEFSLLDKGSYIVGRCMT